MFRSLNSRIVLTALAVGLIAVVVTIIISIVVVDRVIGDQARAQLRQRTSAIALEPQQEARSVVRDARRLVAGGDSFAFVSSSGSVSGPASRFVAADVVAEVDAGHPISRTLDRPDRSVVLEAVPRSGGGGIVGVRRVSDIRASTAILTRGLGIALVAGVLTAILAGTLLGRRLGRPLGRVAGTAHRLAGGERGLPVDPQRIPEIAEIADALHGLDAALAISEGRQREFLLSISHELRTPLTALRGYAEALADGIIPPSQVTEVGRTLTLEAERLGRFMDDLLELARLEAEDFRIEPDEVGVSAVLRSAVDAWKAAATRAGIDLRLDAPADLVVLVDGLRLRQVVDGLLENALRVAPAGSDIRITAFGSSASWAVDVADAGPGLAEEDLEEAFDRGTLRERYRGTRSVGTGLGLSIAWRLVDRMGGRITAERRPEGGALFRVHFAAPRV